jgi:hypothetical protein
VDEPRIGERQRVERQLVKEILVGGHRCPDTQSIRSSQVNMRE